MAINENTRNNLSIGLSHKVSTVSAQETESRNMSEQTALLLGSAILAAFVIVLLFIVI